MKLLSAFSAALALASTCAVAQSTTTSFLRAPMPYAGMPTGPVRLIRLPSLEASARECAMRGAPANSTACSHFYGAVNMPGARIGPIRRDSLCVIVYSDPGDLPHEKDHCRVLRAGGPGGHVGWSVPGDSGIGYGNQGFR